jgi:solute carrier family 25 (mitochondrial phosphate transporter), member 23/24/25/41
LLTAFCGTPLPAATTATTASKDASAVSTSDERQVPQPLRWNIAAWVLGHRPQHHADPRQQQPTAGNGPDASAEAVDAAAVLAAWEDEEEQLQDFEYEYYAEEEELPDALRPLKLLLAGAAAGAVSRTATAPLDRLKMLLQVHDGRTKMTILSGLRNMAAEGSLKAFFKGNGTNVVKIAPETAIKLTANDIYKRFIATDPDEITPGQRMIAGALAGATAQSIIYPLELVKTRLAICPKDTYSGILDCMRKVRVQEGPRAFYRGILPSMLGILPYAGVDITCFELLKEWLLDEYDGKPPPQMILGAGMLSSSIAQFSAYPLALVRTRMQAQGIGGKPPKYTGMYDVLAKTYRNEGVRGLYKGSLTNLAKLAPAAGISWFCFEETKMLLGLSMRS